jgi:hypothetical protein
MVKLFTRVNVRSPLRLHVRSPPHACLRFFFPPCAPNVTPCFLSPPPCRCRIAAPAPRSLAPWPPVHRRCRSPASTRHRLPNRPSPPLPRSSVHPPSSPSPPPSNLASIFSSLYQRLSSSLSLTPPDPVDAAVSLSARTTPVSDIVLLPLHVTTTARPLEALAQATNSTVVSLWPSTFVKGYPG